MSETYTHRIEIYTSTLVIAGAYDLAIYRRASDAINGEQRRYVPLRDATIAPIERAQQAQQVPHLLVDRSEALLVATLQEATPPGDYAREEQVRGVVPVVAMFFTTTFVVRATFYKRPDLSLSEALERFNDNFVPLSNIQVFPLLSTFPPLTRDFAALARDRIVALYQVAEPNAPTAPPAPLPAPAAEAMPEAEPATLPEEELLG
ncbi:MAG TPA: hypothetical protein VFX76_21655 [Roseiflexaceae bacterium]|nr:hypothetical protein [Roseiflexaceae bacterium]